MASVNSIELSIFNAKQFKDSFSESEYANVYFTFGRTLPWENEALPPQADTSESSFYEIWSNMIGAKRITGNDARHCIPRFNWAANTEYAAYDNLIDSKDLKNANTQFYVITDEYRVYKCLSNNYGSLSTVKPAETTTTSHFQTIDGYIWKYMYQLTKEEKLRFTTPSYIPVRTLDLNDSSDQWQVQADAQHGGLHVINLTNHGAGYISDNISISIVGDGADANAYAVRNVTSNTIDSIIIDNLGIHYTYANVIINTDVSVTTPAAARAIISPRGGHGSDALFELGGNYIILDVSLQGEQSGQFIVGNDYREVAIIDNPKEYATGVGMTSVAVSQVTTLTLNGTSVDYILDETVYQGTAIDTATYKGVVTKWDKANNVLKLSNTIGVPVTDLITGVTSTASRFVDSVQAPDMQAYTGNLLYIDNIQPIQRSADQNETFQIVLKF